MRLEYLLCWILLGEIVSVLSMCFYRRSLFFSGQHSCRLSDFLTWINTPFVSLGLEHTVARLRVTAFSFPQFYKQSLNYPNLRAPLVSCWDLIFCSRVSGRSKIYPQIGVCLPIPIEHGRTKKSDWAQVSLCFSFW